MIASLWLHESHAGPAATPPSDRHGERRNRFTAIESAIHPRSVLDTHAHERLPLDAIALCQQLLRLVSSWPCAIAGDKMTFPLPGQGERT